MLPAVSLTGHLQNAAQNYCTYERNAREIYDCHLREVFNTKIVKDWIVPTVTSLAIAILTAPLDAVVALLSTFTIIPLFFLDNKIEHLINTVMAVCVAVIAPFVFLINLFGAGQFLPLEYSRSYLNYRPSLKMLLIASKYRPRLHSSIMPLASILIKDNVLAKLTREEKVLAILLNSKLSEDLYEMRNIAGKYLLPLQSVMYSLNLKKEEKIILIKKLLPFVDPNSVNVYDTSDSMTVVDTALTKACDLNYNDIVDLLLPFAKKCSTEFFVDAFYSACNRGNKEIIHKIYNACPDLVPFINTHPSQINKAHGSQFDHLSLDLIKLLTELGVKFIAEDLGQVLARGNYEVAEWIADHNPSIENLDKICILFFSYQTYCKIVYNLARLGLIKTCKLMHACYGAYGSHANSIHSFTKKNYNLHLTNIIIGTFSGYIKNQILDNYKLIEAFLPELQSAINSYFSSLAEDLQSSLSIHKSSLITLKKQDLIVHSMLFLLPYANVSKETFEDAMIYFAKGGYFEALQALLTYNLDVNSPRFVATPEYPWTSHNIIHIAVINNDDLRIAKLLVEHGAYFPRDVFKEAIPPINGIEIDPYTQEVLTPMFVYDDLKPVFAKLKSRMEQVRRHCDQLNLLQDYHNEIRIALKLQLVALGVIQALGHIVADYVYGGIQSPRAIEAVSKDEQDADEVQAKTWDDLGT